MKVQYILDVLKANKNKFTVAQLTEHIRADAGDAALARRTRRALFVARKAGIVLEPVRDGGKAVVAYQLQGSVPEAALAAPARKTSRGRTKTVTAKQISKEVDAIVAKNKAPSKKVTKTVAKTVDLDAKAKNLATMKAVSAKNKSLESRLTPEQKAIREEFDAEEAEYARQEERAAARASVREYLTKESYVE
jgi:hypothetical protein